MEFNFDDISTEIEEEKPFKPDWAHDYEVWLHIDSLKLPKQKEPSERFVYVLRCVDNKMYIGQTYNLTKRLEAHCSGAGARFTTIYPPECLIGVLRCPDETTATIQEEQWTNRVIARIGRANVRGGSWTKVYKELYMLAQRIPIHTPEEMIHTLKLTDIQEYHHLLPLLPLVQTRHYETGGKLVWRKIPNLTLNPKFDFSAV